MRRAVRIFLALLLLTNAAVAQIISVPSPSATGTAATGQIPGTTTNDFASVGSVGELAILTGSSANSTVTITIASPGVITWTAHGLALGNSVTFTTSGALPTGLTASTLYWVIPIDANTFSVATTPANAIAGTAIVTTGSQSGTQTATGPKALTTGNPFSIGFLNLAAGDWDISGIVVFTGGSTTTAADAIAGISTTLNNVGVFGATSYVQNSPYAATAFSNNFELLVGPSRLSINATTPVYLACRADFSVSTANCFGQIRARRVR